MLALEDFSPEFSRLLAQNGWSPNRRVATSDWEAVLTQEGYASNPLSIAILESLGGLTIHLPPAGSSYSHELHFDPVRAATGEFDRTEEWRDILTIDFFPLGEEVFTGSVIWSGSDGQFYFGRGFGLYRLGHCLRDAMDQLAFLRTPLELCIE